MPASPISAAASSALHRRDGDRNAPVDAAERVEQVRRRRAERERADEDADHQPHVALGPGRRELHADRIDAGHRDAGDEAQQRHRPRSPDRRPAAARSRSRRRSADAAMKRRGSKRSARPSTALAMQPTTKPACTPLVSAACMKFDSRYSATSAARRRTPRTTAPSRNDLAERDDRDRCALGRRATVMRRSAVRSSAA